MTGNGLSHKRLLAIGVLILFSVSLVTSVLFRTEWLPSILTKKEWIQTLADLIQLIIWVAAGIILIFKYLASSGREPGGPFLSVIGNLQIGKNNKIKATSSDASIKNNKQIGDENKIIVSDD